MEDKYNKALDSLYQENYEDFYKNILQTIKNRYKRSEILFKNYLDKYDFSQSDYFIKKQIDTSNLYYLYISLTIYNFDYIFNNFGDIIYDYGYSFYDIVLNQPNIKPMITLLKLYNMYNSPKMYYQMIKLYVKIIENKKDKKIIDESYKYICDIENHMLFVKLIHENNILRVDNRNMKVINDENKLLKSLIAKNLKY